MIKKTLLAISIAFMSVHSFAYDNEVCKNQRQSIEKQIVDAKRYNNQRRLQGLEKALERVNKVCSKQMKKSV